jgi:periplasmic protein CpxP/Spy
MKKIFFLVLFLSAAIIATAEKKTAETKAKEKTAEMTKNLSLTAEQSSQIYTVHLNAIRSIDEYEAKKTGKSLRKKQKDVVKKLREAQFKKILTSAQYKKYQAMKEQQKKAEKEEKKRLEQIKDLGK